MRAIAIEAASQPLVLVEVDRPTPGAGEVLVKVLASSVNGFDRMLVSGYLVGMMEHRYPVIPGKDFAGVVEEVGGGTTRFKVGDQVFGVVMESVLQNGSWTEYLVVKEDAFITNIPDGVDMASAGAIGLAGAAALDSIEAAKIEIGESVLIVGATGGVGTIAIQYAASLGANVIATARPGDEAEFVTEIGAVAAVDPDKDLAEQVMLIARAGVDVILHFAGDPARLPLVLSERGRIVSTLGFGTDKHPLATAIMASPSVSTLNRLGADLAAENIGVAITDTFELEEVAQALEDFQGGAIGKFAIHIK